MAKAETVAQQIESSDPIVLDDLQRKQLEAGILEIADVVQAVSGQLQTSCQNEQASPPSRYNEDLGGFEPSRGNKSATCGYGLSVDEEALAVRFFCTKSGELCTRRSKLSRATSTLVNKVVVFSVPRG